MRRVRRRRWRGLSYDIRKSQYWGSGGGRGRGRLRGGANKKQMEKGEDENKKWRKIGRRGERGSIVSAQGGIQTGGKERKEQEGIGKIPRSQKGGV